MTLMWASKSNNGRQEWIVVVDIFPHWCKVHFVWWAGLASSVTRVSMEVETVDADKAGKNNLDIKESTPEMSFDD